QRHAAHSVDVAQRVGGGDLAVHVRVVDDRREEVDRLDQRRSALPPVHTRIVTGPEVDQHAVVVQRGDVTQHLSELACGEVARSTGAGDQLCQAYGHFTPHSPLKKQPQSTQTRRAIPVSCHAANVSRTHATTKTRKHEELSISHPDCWLMQCTSTIAAIPVRKPRKESCNPFDSSSSCFRGCILL